MNLSWRGRVPIGLAYLLAAGQGCSNHKAAGGVDAGGWVYEVYVPPLELGPAEAGIVIGFDWAHLQDTELFNRLYSKRWANGLVRLDIRMGEICNFWPVRDTETVVAAGGGSLPESFGVIFSKGTATGHQMEGCFDRQIEKLALDWRIHRRRQGNRTVFTFDQPPIQFAWRQDVQIVARTVEGAEAVFAGILEHRSSIRENLALWDLLGRTDRSATMYGAWIFKDGDFIKQEIGDLIGGPEKAIGLFVTVNLDKRLAIHAGIRTASVGDASALRDKLQVMIAAIPRIDPKRSALGDLVLSTDATDVLGRLDLDEKKLLELQGILEEAVERIH
jgi:hypothetical protein